MSDTCTVCDEPVEDYQCQIKTVLCDGSGSPWIVRHTACAGIECDCDQSP